MIPVKDILRIEKKGRMFVIVVEGRGYHFQAYTDDQLSIITTLLFQMSKSLPSSVATLNSPTLYSDSAQVSISQFERMAIHKERVDRWKEVVGRVLEDDDRVRPSITTIKLESTGAVSLRGVILRVAKSRIEKVVPNPIRHSRFKRSSALVGRDEIYIERIRTSVDIAAQIASLDLEIEMLGHVSE